MLRISNALTRLKRNIGQTINTDAIPRINEVDSTLKDIPNKNLQFIILAWINHSTSIIKLPKLLCNDIKIHGVWYLCLIFIFSCTFARHFYDMAGRFQYPYILTFSWMLHQVYCMACLLNLRNDTLCKSNQHWAWLEYLKSVFIWNFDSPICLYMYVWN